MLKTVSYTPEQNSFCIYTCCFPSERRTVQDLFSLKLQQLQSPPRIYLVLRDSVSRQEGFPVSLSFEVMEEECDSRHPCYSSASSISCSTLHHRSFRVFDKHNSSSRSPLSTSRHLSLPMLTSILLTFILLTSSVISVVSSCGYPGSPGHASVAFSSESIETGTVATYTCDNGYELLGPPRRTCTDNGTWVPQGIPFCGEWLFFVMIPLSSHIMTMTTPSGYYQKPSQQASQINWHNRKAINIVKRDFNISVFALEIIFTETFLDVVLSF
jgi:hypothetical protein